MDTNKARALVEYLTRHDRAVTAKELAGFLNLSVRSVKSYISSINGEAKAPFIISGHSGYTTNPAAARNYLRAVRRENRITRNAQTGSIRNFCDTMCQN